MNISHSFNCEAFAWIMQELEAHDYHKTFLVFNCHEK
jgi:hypothetical protein